MNIKLEQSLLNLIEEHGLTSLQIGVMKYSNRHQFTAAAHAAGKCELGGADTLPEALGQAIIGVKAKVGLMDPIPVADEALELV